MSMTVKEVLLWIARQPATSQVWIDEGGLILETDTGAYIEVGGKRDKDGDKGTV